MPRLDLLDELATLVGGNALKVVDARDAWPAIVDVQGLSGKYRLAIHVSEFSEKSYRGRDHLERRMQNPSTDHPVINVDGAISTIIGVWKKGLKPVLMGFDAGRRIGKTTRQSYFAPLWQLQQAADQGWTEHDSSSEETLIAFRPEFLPAYVEMISRGVVVAPEDIVSIADAAGLNEAGGPSAEAVERARRTTTALIRSAVFRKLVANAYSGLCAMCGLDFGLVEGAHIYPASAPGSTDEVQNGIALCSNHHNAFDRHLIFIQPTTWELRLHPALCVDPLNAGCAQFVATTKKTLSLPSDLAAHPSPKHFDRRYEHFEARYGWARS